MFQKVVRPKGVDVHVPAHADELRSGEVVEGDIVLEELGHADDIFRGGGLSGRSDLYERERVGTPRSALALGFGRIARTIDDPRDVDVTYLSEKLFEFVTVDDLFGPQT